MLIKEVVSAFILIINKKKSVFFKFLKRDIKTPSKYYFIILIKAVFIFILVINKKKDIFFKKDNKRY